MERDNIVLDALREVAVEKFYGNGKRQYCARRSKRGGSREVLQYWRCRGHGKRQYCARRSKRGGSREVLR